MGAGFENPAPIVYSDSQRERYSVFLPFRFISAIAL